MPDLQQYLNRIGLQGSVDVSIETLRRIHRAHVLAIPYENLDVYLERPVSRDPAAIFDKIVNQGRGGWCYEMNGLLGWALKEIGFTVTPHIGGVFRAEHGDEAFGNHLMNTVDLEGTWVVDVGIGDFVKEPVLLQEGSFDFEGAKYRLEKLNDGSWRFHNRENAMPPSFDFYFEPADDTRLQEVSSNLQTDPESMFRQNLICQLMTESGMRALVGITFTDTDQGIEKHIIKNEQELESRLRESFAINPPPLDGIWEKLQARHDELFAES